MESLKDLRQTGEYAEYIKKIGWEVDKFQDTYIFLKKFLFWNFVKVQRPRLFKVNSLIRYIERKYRFSTIYIEPSDYKQYQELLDVGFRKYNSPFLPSKTIQIDLEKTENKLIKEMHYKTRYNIKKVTGDKLQVTCSKDIEKFADFWQKCARQRGMFLSQKEEIKAICRAFDREAAIHVATDNSKNWLASILRISTNDISYYMYAAATSTGKKLFAPTVITWEAIRSAKKEGKKIFDFEGIYDERFPLRSWKGFSRFKRGFGGKEVECPGCVSKIII
jgi:lipid II:glycine glycyltransferase (peptidoglycan interpeptide bridge formation enzyme)